MQFPFKLHFQVLTGWSGESCGWQYVPGQQFSFGHVVQSLSRHCGGGGGAPPVKCLPVMVNTAPSSPLVAMVFFVHLPTVSFNTCTEPSFIPCYDRCVGQTNQRNCSCPAVIEFHTKTVFRRSVETPVCWAPALRIVSIHIRSVQTTIVTSRCIVLCNLNRCAGRTLTRCDQPGTRDDVGARRSGSCEQQNRSSTGGVL